MKLSTSIKSFAAATLLAVSASSALAVTTTLTLSAPVSGPSFTNTSLGSFAVGAIPSDVSGSLGYADVLNFGSFTISLAPVTFSGSTIGHLYTATGNTFSWLNVPTGSYNLLASGTLTGLGIVAAVVNVTPVPEPETLAMMLAGLGLMGAIARRRRSNSEG